jgi:guanylate kinase
MKKELFLVIGESGCGKDYSIDRLCKEFKKGKVVSRTTRARRPNEKGTHLFVDSEQADKEFDKAIAKTIINNNRYYVLEEDLIDKTFYVIDFKGVHNMKDKDKYNTITVYIDVNPFKRAYRMFKRRDKIKDIIYRLKHDGKELRGFKADLTFKNNNEFYDYFKEKFESERV